MLGKIVLDYAGPSIGVIAADEDLPDPQTLIARADAAMYVAKHLRRTEATPFGQRKGTA